MHIFYTPDLSKTSNELYSLNEEESKHCIRVLRLTIDDRIILIDGIGGFYEAKILEPNPKRTLIQILSKRDNYNNKGYYLHLAVAPTKNIERFEWFLEKATEIGIDEITPIICDRSERKEVKIERLNKVITSAVKQSIKAYHPLINEPKRLKSFLEGNFQTADCFIAHCNDGEKKEIKNIGSSKSNYLILIGPEGDFTSQEVELAIHKSFIPITLGNSRLRTETAALEACFEINFLNR
ncbi:MAG: rRNA ((1498)-N(3))-methyltransferase [Sphingobacteriales bacterium]|nr:rRNA ((1498)-N(3))-methyltransferase [Sphingobacteriales bacterium]